MKIFKIFTYTLIALLSISNKTCVTAINKQETSKQNWIYVDFNESMKKGHPDFEKNMEQNGNKCHPLVDNSKMTNIEILNLAKNIYDKNNLSVNKKRNNKKIPKIIHQIWLGSALPEKYKRLRDTWIKNHPDWEYKLWTDKDLKTFEMQNKEIFDRSKKYSYANKSDILRMEILYKFGGLYIDTDFEFVKQFDALNDNYEFYCGFEPMASHAILGNALIASVPGHPILKFYIENLKANIAKWSRVKMDDFTRVLAETSPQYFTDCVLQTITKYDGTDLCENIILLPTTYFYPIQGIGYVQSHGKTIADFLKISPEAYGVHYWDLSWVK